MKKLFLLAILIGLFLSMNLSAQIKVPRNENTLTHEQKMLPFAMSMALSTIGEIHDENYFTVLQIFQKQMPHWANELKPVVEMDKNIADYKRLDIVMTAAKALRARSNESDKWQMLVGEQFGSIYAMIKKSKAEKSEINADDLRFKIELIHILANKAPNDIPWDIVNKLKDFAELKDKENLNSEENIDKITEKVMKLLNAISN